MKNIPGPRMKIELSSNGTKDENTDKNTLS